MRTLPATQLCRTCARFATNASQQTRSENSMLVCTRPTDTSAYCLTSIRRRPVTGHTKSMTSSAPGHLQHGPIYRRICGSIIHLSATYVGARTPAAKACGDTCGSTARARNTCVHGTAATDLLVRALHSMPTFRVFMKARNHLYVNSVVSVSDTSTCSNGMHERTERVKQTH